MNTQHNHLTIKIPKWVRWLHRHTVLLSLDSGLTWQPSLFHPPVPSRWKQSQMFFSETSETFFKVFVIPMVQHFINLKDYFCWRWGDNQNDVWSHWVKICPFLHKCLGKKINYSNGSGFGCPYMIIFVVVLLTASSFAIFLIELRALATF